MLVSGPTSAGAKSKGIEMSTTVFDSDSLIGSTLMDSARHRVGTIEEIYFDEATDRPLWMLVRTGRFGSRRSFVPLADAWPEGEVVVTPHSRREILAGPQLDATDAMPDERVQDLYGHYAMVYEAPADEAPRQSLAERVLRWVP